MENRTFIVVGDYLGEAKVRDFSSEIFADHDVASRQITMHHFLLGQIGHALRDVVAPAQQQSSGVRTFVVARNSFQTRLKLIFVLAKELFEVSKGV